MLPTCQAEELAAHFVDKGFAGSVEISGNDDEGICE
jgi:hypothetical protein